MFKQFLVTLVCFLIVDVILFATILPVMPILVWMMIGSSCFLAAFCTYMDHFVYNDD